ncbi:hypothetical protein M0P65_07970 [Candidatus Gracilibacteria bacterium]|jgi:hypothetical protein|nr:hypothetical protein [Candidatus Gracilibacteria bacterium]
MKIDKIKKILKEEILNVLIESIDLVDVNKIENLTEQNFLNKIIRFGFSIHDDNYVLEIPLKDELYIEGVRFGIKDNETNVINTSRKVNEGYVLKTLSIVFSLLIYALKKYNIQKFHFMVLDKRNERLYLFYLEKYFKDFNLTKDGIQYIFDKK